MRGTHQVLKDVALFSSVSDRQLRKLAKHMDEFSAPAGKKVTVEGKGGVGFFIILEGQATVEVSGQKVGRLGPGDSFGETALIDGGERSATVTAETDLKLLSMTAWTFKPFVKANPEVAWALLETLVKRRRAT